MTRAKWLPAWQLRALFAAGLSAMYAAEVPAYGTLVAVSEQVNADVVARQPDAERFGSLRRVTAERHGAIRVGSPAELAAVADLFAAFGMLPVGYYDLRCAASPSRWCRPPSGRSMQTSCRSTLSSVHLDAGHARRALLRP